MILVVCCCNFLGIHNVSGMGFIEFTEMDGITYVYHIDKETLKKTPSWDGNIKNLPLSMEQAVNIGKKWAANKIKDKQDVLTLKEISLTNICRTGIKNRWVYEISFESKNKNSDYSTTYMAVFFLDGTIIEPKKIKTNTKK